MKFILALTICLFLCKEKEPVLSELLYGLVGTYEAASTKLAPIFQVLLPDYANFNETTTAIISQTGTDWSGSIETKS